MRNKIAAVAIILLTVFLLIFFIYYQGFSFFKNNNAGDLTCVDKQAEKIVRGQSLEGLLNDGEKVQVLYNYYNCNEIKRNDIIIYNYIEKNQPSEIIKTIKAIPGDTIVLRDNETGTRNILVNDEILKTSTGEPYVLSANKKTMIALHINDYNGVIPPNNYVILGNLANGSIDSIKFGFVKKDNIIGKAIKFID